MEIFDFFPVWIALGAIPGALSRYYLSLICAQKRFNDNFPVSTLLINLSGAFGMGFLTRVLQAMNAGHMLDFSALLKLGHPKRALLYGLGSPLGGFLALEMGIALDQGL